MGLGYAARQALELPVRQRVTGSTPHMVPPRKPSPKHLQSPSPGLAQLNVRWGAIIETLPAGKELPGNATPLQR